MWVFIYSRQNHVCGFVISYTYYSLFICEKSRNIYKIYINNIEKSEKEIKDIIRTRIACAGLSYQIYKYEKRKSIDHAPEVLNWKEICIGKKSSAEFVEVRKVWFEWGEKCVLQRGWKFDLLCKNIKRDLRLKTELENMLEEYVW